MSILHYVGAVLVLLLITAVGAWSGRRVKSAKDFTSGGRKAGAGIVMGAVIGTLVGGASTIGTAQLAFNFGFSAWWFTLGGGIGCLLLAAGFSRPLYESGISTIPQFFAREYGQTSSTLVALLTSLGALLSMVAQVLAGVALISSVSGLSATISTVIIALLMLTYVTFGGLWGVGYVGIAKILLLYVAVAVCGVVAVSMQGGISVFHALLPADRYFSLFARGFAVDAGAGCSLLVGVLTTQSYIQALISARSLRVSRAGLLGSAVLIPLVGIAPIFVGMYMKLNYPDIVSEAALPMFIMQHLHPLIGGVILATLLVALVGTGAGLALGLSSMLCNDIWHVYIHKNISDKANLRLNRLVIVLLLAGAALFSAGNLGSLILSWSFLSMALRGAVAFAPLCAAIFLHGRIAEPFVVAAMLVGPACVLAGKFLLPPWLDPLFPGILINAAILCTGLLRGRKENTSGTPRG